jgi:hypothetical protein
LVTPLAAAPEVVAMVLVTSTVVEHCSVATAGAVAILNPRLPAAPSVVTEVERLKPQPAGCGGRMAMADGAASAHEDATTKASEPPNATAKRPDQRRPPTTHPSREKLFLESYAPR